MSYLDSEDFNTSSQYVLDLEIDETAQCSNNVSVPTHVFQDFLTNFQYITGSYNLLLTDQKTGKQTYCCMTDMHNGKTLKVPQNVYDNILTTKDIMVQLYTSPIPKGDLIKLKPCTKDFIDIKMLDKELEKILSKFSMLSSNQNLTIPYNGKKYAFIITDVYSDNNTAVSIIDVVNRNIKLDLNNPFVDELVNDKKKSVSNCPDDKCDCEPTPVQFRLSKVVGGIEYDGKTPMSELRKNAF